MGVDGRRRAERAGASGRASDGERDRERVKEAVFDAATVVPVKHAMAAK